MEEFVIKGQWFLADNKNNVLPGIISYNDSGIKLEVFGYLLGLEKFDLGEQYFILGTLENNKKVTLVNCFTTSLNYGNSEYEIISVNYMLIGEHFDSEKDLRFKGLKFSYTNLNNLLWDNNITLDNKVDDLEFRIDYKKPFHFEGNINELMSMSIAAEYKSEYKRNNPYSWQNVNIKNYITISSIKNDSIDFGELNKYKNSIDGLMTLAVGKPQKTIELTGILKDSREVEILPKESGEGFCELISPNDMFISLKNLGAKFFEYILMWFEKYNKYEDVFNLYFFLLKQKLYIDQEFLFRVQILEAYHRINNPKHEKEVEKKKYTKELKIRIKGKISDTDFQYISEILGWANKLTLQERLVELFSNCVIFNKIIESKETADLIKDSLEQSNSLHEKIGYFANNIKTTRNFLTHYDNTKNKGIVDTFELYFMNRVMDKVIKYYILKEFGLNDVEIIEIFKVNRLIDREYERIF